MSVVGAWLLTYALHSTVLLGSAALITRFVRGEAWRETVWKAALVGGVVTATLSFGPQLPVPLAVERPKPAERVAPVAPAPLEPVALEAESDAGGAGDAALVVPNLDAGALTGAAPAGTAVGSASGALPWTTALLVGWAALALGLMGRLGWRQWRLMRALSDRTEVEDAGLLATLARLRREAGVWRPVRLTTTGASSTPLALGLSEICVPDRFAARLDADAQRGALAHELAHLARRDPAWQLAAGVIGALFFFQPLNILARRRIRESAENLCDDWAVRQTGSAVGLARCLAEVAEWVAPGERIVPEGVAAMAEGGSPLLQRVERVLSGRIETVPPPAWRVAGAVALLAVAALAVPGFATNGAPDGALAGEPELEAGDVAPSVAGQEEIVRHPRPSDALVDRWRWAEGAASDRGDRRYWIAYAFEGPAEDDHVLVTDLTGVDLKGLGSGPRLAERIGDVRGRHPVVALFEMVERRPVQITARSAALGAELDGRPLYWLGGAVDAESLRLLTELLERTGEDALREPIVETIALHRTTASVMPLLTRVLRDERGGDVREGAVEGLAWHPTAATVRLLHQTALEDRDEQIRVEAVETLGEIHTEAAMAALRDIYGRSESTRVRSEVVEALGERPDDGVVRVLEEVVQVERDPRVVNDAIEALAERGRMSAGALRSIALSHRDAKVRRQAVEELEALPPEDAARILDDVVRHETDPRVLHQVVETISELPSRLAVPRLTRLVRSHPLREVRREALDELERHDEHDPDPDPDWDYDIDPDTSTARVNR